MEAAGFAFSVTQTLLAALSYPPLQEMFTMWGYQSELDSLTSTVSTVSAVLLDAQSVDVEKLSNSERNLIERLKEAVYDADDLLDEFSTLAKQQHQLCMEANEKSLKKVQRLFSRFKELKVGYSMSRKVKKIRKKLDQIVDDAKFGFIKVDRQPIRKREETCAYVNENRIVGRDVDKERIVNMLLDPNIQGDVPVLAIVGMGGLGKTSLAQIVCNDKRIQTQFHNQTYWVCVSDQDQKQFNIKAILAKIYKAATDESNIGDLDMNSLVRRLRDLLNQNKYLLVLDDVWTEDRIEGNKLLDRMRYLTALQSLKIVELPLKDLPEWIGCLPCLHFFEINKCKNLKSLPEALRKVTSLKRLELESCTIIQHTPVRIMPQ